MPTLKQVKYSYNKVISLASKDDFYNNATKQQIVLVQTFINICREYAQENKKGKHIEAASLLTILLGLETKLRLIEEHKIKANSKVNFQNLDEGANLKIAFSNFITLAFKLTNTKTAAQRQKLAPILSASSTAGRVKLEILNDAMGKAFVNRMTTSKAGWMCTSSDEDGLTLKCHGIYFTSAVNINWCKGRLKKSMAWIELKYYLNLLQ